MEILYYLIRRERYGNELRMLLNAHLGDDAVSTGKLYPVLKKLEKAGLIRKLKKKMKDKIENEPGMTRRLLTRGVERVYFEITEEGRERLDSAVSFATSVLFNTKMSEQHGRVADLIEAQIYSFGDEVQIGVAVPNTMEGVVRARKMLPELDPHQVIFLLMTTKRAQESPLRTEDLEFEINSFPSRFDDVPLKANYLDAAVSFVNLEDVFDMKEFFREIVRTVRPRGVFIIVGFSRTESDILRTILTDNVEHDGEGPFEGNDPSEVMKVLERYLKDIRVERFDELFVIGGKKVSRKKNSTRK